MKDQPMTTISFYDTNIEATRFATQEDWDLLYAGAMRKHHALLHILGDRPAPNEDAYERCRRQAAEALGYGKPELMHIEDKGQTVWAEGIAARKAGKKIDNNPYRDAPGSVEDNCWRAAWMAENHNIKEASR